MSGSLIFFGYGAAQLVYVDYRPARLIAARAAAY